MCWGVLPPWGWQSSENVSDIYGHKHGIDVWKSSSQPLWNLKERGLLKNKQQLIENVKRSRRSTIKDRYVDGEH